MLEVLDRLTSVASSDSSSGKRHFQFFTSYGHVMMLIAANPEIRERDLADSVGVTENSVQQIVHDLAASGYVTVQKSGRRTCYRLREQTPIRDPDFADKTVGEFADFVANQA
jgi:predicted transcriptional regulator